MMGLLGRSCKSIELSHSHSIHQHYLLRRSSIFMGKRFASLEGSLDRLDTKTMLTNVRLARGCLRASASQKAVKKLRKRQSEALLEINKDMPDEPEMDVAGTGRKEDTVQVDEVSLLENKASRLDKIPSRENVLQACIVTSSLMAALGVTIRQVSHIASVEGLPVFDCSMEPSFSFEIWHMQLIAGLVVLVSSCRYLLLKLWPEFEESSQAANQQILTSLEPLDYILVAFLPGFSEGTPFPWRAASTLRIQLVISLSSWNSFWNSSFGKWKKILIYHLGDICGVCLWLCDYCFFEYNCADGLLHV
ncbi:unnamed protein product [Rhodiola kirilowii]